MLPQNDPTMTGTIPHPPDHRFDGSSFTLTQSRHFLYDAEVFMPRDRARYRSENGPSDDVVRPPRHLDIINPRARDGVVEGVGPAIAIPPILM